MEVIGSNLIKVPAPPLLQLDLPTVVEVKQGQYLVRVYLPSGEIVSTQADVIKGQTADVQLLPAAKSPIESMGWAYYLKQSDRRAGHRAFKPAVKGTAPDRGEPPPRLTLWWHRSTDEWIGDPVPPYLDLYMSPRPYDALRSVWLRLPLHDGQFWLKVSPGGDGAA